MGSGTTSKILRHFTGGPPWDKSLRKQKEDPRPDEEARSRLIDILSSSKLKVSLHPDYIEYRYGESLITGIEVPNFCCVAEIPIQHLSHHSKRYGKYAIGFERDYLQAEKFRPVSYFLSHDDFRAPALFDLYDIVLKHPEEEQKKKAMKALDLLSAYIKSLTTQDMDTIYTEREWRYHGDFHFNPHKVKFVISPREQIQDIRSAYRDKYPESNFLEYELLLEH